MHHGWDMHVLSAASQEHSPSEPCMCPPVAGTIQSQSGKVAWTIPEHLYTTLHTGWSLQVRRAYLCSSISQLWEEQRSLCLPCWESQWERCRPPPWIPQTEERGGSPFLPLGHPVRKVQTQWVSLDLCQHFSWSKSKETPAAWSGPESGICHWDPPVVHQWPWSKLQQYTIAVLQWHLWMWIGSCYRIELSGSNCISWSVSVKLVLLYHSVANKPPGSNKLLLLEVMGLQQG